MKSRFMVALPVAAILFALPLLMGAEEAEKVDLEGVKCPVSGRAVVEDGTAEYLGKTVYFCCQNCPKAFTKSPEKFATKASHQLAQTGQIIQVACPISGRELNPETAIEVANVKVAFCCENCQAKTEKAEGEEQLKLVFANLKKGFTLQTKCPVSGRAIDVSKTVEHKGEKVYFCCENCPKAFAADPEKYVAKLPQLKETK